MMKTHVRSLNKLDCIQWSEMHVFLQGIPPGICVLLFAVRISRTRA